MMVGVGVWTEEIVMKQTSIPGYITVPWTVILVDTVGRGDPSRDTVQL